jgi:signal transduction histidine kinase
LVDGVISAASALVKGKRLALGRDLPEEPTAVMADRTRVRQVLLNLVSNAVKFTDSGGVTVSVRRADGRIEVAVSDTGIGMRPDEVERAFDEFEQLEGKHRNKPGGTGLGLPISRQLVRMHGGELEAESAPGKGSTFRFSLPEWKDPA